MTKTEKRIRQLQNFQRIDIELIKFAQALESPRDEQYAADRLYGVEKELRRLVANGNGEAARVQSRMIVEKL